ncbi:hypothetical protein BD779DRAFT_581384 [Infundibulicybe gibba]|nr:hypothetical protein BD779DRAFT_581384 [Infundibulicybe gibba]
MDCVYLRAAAASTGTAYTNCAPPLPGTSHPSLVLFHDQDSISHVRNSYGYGAASPPITNNPFLGYNNNYSAPQMQQQYQQYQQQPSSPTSYGGGYPSQGFQPTSSFGQQLAAHVSGSSYGYLQGQQNAGMQPQTGYNPVQQQLQSNPGYVAQFDPYASIGQGWDGQSQPQNQTQNQNQNTQMQNQHMIQSPTQRSGGNSLTSTSPSGNPHPREYIRTHKAEIESWDTYAWKQLLGAFDNLKDSWEVRKNELGAKVGQLQRQLQQGGGGYYPGQIQQEAARLQGLLKESDSNFDSVAASSFQMHEVFSGYRQSGDLASKRRVREASNAALQSLPDWPPQVY